MPKRADLSPERADTTDLTVGTAPDKTTQRDGRAGENPGADIGRSTNRQWTPVRVNRDGCRTAHVGTGKAIVWQRDKLGDFRIKIHQDFLITGFTGKEGDFCLNGTEDSTCGSTQVDLVFSKPCGKGWVIDLELGKFDFTLSPQATGDPNRRWAIKREAEIDLGEIEFRFTNVGRHVQDGDSNVQIAVVVAATATGGLVVCGPANDIQCGAKCVAGVAFGGRQHGPLRTDMQTLKIITGDRGKTIQRGAGQWNVFHRCESGIECVVGFVFDFL